MDYREESDDIFAEFYDKLMAFTEEQCQKRGLTYSVEITLDAPPAPVSYTHLADLIVINGDPTQEIERMLDSVVMVMKSGSIVWDCR